MGITKLATDNNDHSMNIQTVANASSFTWNHGQCSMHFKHSPTNLPELHVSWSDTSSFALTTDVSKNQFNNLTPDDVAKIFGSLSKKELHSLLNPEPLSNLEKENQCCHRRLKFISRSNMDHFSSLRATPSRLKTVTSLPCLSFLLGKTRPKHWLTKRDHNHD